MQQYVDVMDEDDAHLGHGGLQGAQYQIQHQQEPRINPHEQQPYLEGDHQQQQQMDEESIVNAFTERYRRQLVQDLDDMFMKLQPQPNEPYNDFAHRLFEQQVGNIDPKKFEAQYMSVMENAITLYRLFVSNNLVGDRDRQTIQNHKRFRRLLEGIRHAYWHVDSEYRGKAVMNENSDVYVPPEISMFRVSTIDYEENEPHQNLLLFYLSEAFHKGYRRYKGAVYEQIFTDDEQGHLPTHAWRQVCTMEEFVYNSVKKEVNYRQWQNLTHRAGTARNMIEYLNKSRADTEFPWLVPDRTVVAWRNGLYMADSKQFYTYDRVQQEIAPDVVACKYFDYDFDMRETPAGRDGWYQLPTPVFDSILTFQGLDDDAKKMMYVMIGRLRYELGRHDRWQVVPFIKGMAGTGKSTIGKYCLELFEFADIGILSSNIEDKFGLYALMDKFAWICLEVKERFGLPQSEFQSMVSGEHMNIPVKNERAVSTVWNSPGFMCGNEMANWIDAAGSMSRRLFVWEFYHLVREADPTLEPRLKNELGMFIRKVNEGYREFADRYGGIDVWNIPECEYFRQTRERAKAVINPIVSFIRTSEMVRINREGGYIPFPRFRELYIQWAKTMGRSTRFESDHFLPVFADYQLDCKTDNRMVKNRMIKAFFIIGLEEVPHGDR